MNEPITTKNLKYVNGLPFFKRWTVLNVPTQTVETIIQYSRDNKLDAGEALVELVDKATADKRPKNIIGLDYWQVISHYTDYFREFAEQMLAAGHQIHIVTAVGEQRAPNVFKEIDKTKVPYTKKHKVIFKDPAESPALKLAKCQELGITVFYDDRDDVCRELTKNGIVAMRVTRKDNSRYDLEAEQK